VDWWKKALEALVSSGKQEFQNSLQKEVVVHDDGLPMKSERLVLHVGRDLIERLKIPKVGKPLALGAVLVRFFLLSLFPPRFLIIISFCKYEINTSTRPSKFELQHVNRGVLPFHLFMSTKTSIYDPGWLPARIAKAVIGRPVWWALEQMGIVGEEGILPEGGRGRPQQRDTNWWGDYVLISLAEKAAVGVMERQERRGRGSRTDALYTMEEFRKVFGGVAGGDEILGEMDASILVKYLERDKGVLVVDKEVCSIYKFAVLLLTISFCLGHQVRRQNVPA
jgi:charged multivesicular body protein 7